MIPAIGVDKIVVEGVSLADLKKGPGHYPETPLPGQEGNAAIAGHRTTYGAPFNRLDELEPGDEITVTTVQGEFTYEVTETADRVAHPGGRARGQGRQPAHPHGLPPEVQRPRSASSWCRTWPRTRSRSPGRPAATTSAPPAARWTDIDGEGAPAWPAIVLGICCAR